MILRKKENIKVAAHEETFQITDSLMTMEGAVLDECNEVDVLATAEAQQKFDIRWKLNTIRRSQNGNAR